MKGLQSTINRQKSGDKKATIKNRELSENP